MTPDVLVNDAVEAMRANDLRRALTSVLAAWCARRLPRLAAVAQWLTARLGPVAPVADQDAWLKLAKARDELALPGLLATLTDTTFRHAEERAQQLLAWEDPRITTALLGVLSAPRYRSSGAQWFYERLFKALAAQRDPRAPPALTALADRYHEVVTNTYGPVLAKNIREAVAKMSVDDAVNEPAALLAELEAFFESERADELRARGARDAAAEREAKLRAQVAERPDDDGLRQVWADVLVEQGDPRGELINFQLMERQGGLAPDQLEQLRVLQSRHRDRLLGAIAPKVVNAVFDRGVAVHVELGRNWGTPEVSEPEWKQVRGVTLPPERWRSEEWARLLAALPSLDTVMRVDPRVVERLYQLRPGFVLEHALFVLDEPATALPPVRHVLARELQLAPLLRRAQSEVVTLEYSGADPAEAVEALATGLAARTRWVDAAHLLDPLGWYGWCFELDAQSRRLEVRGRFEKEANLERLRAWMKALRALDPREIVVRAGGERDVAYLPLRAIDEAAVRAHTQH